MKPPHRRILGRDSGRATVTPLVVKPPHRRILTRHALPSISRLFQVRKVLGERLDACTVLQQIALKHASLIGVDFKLPFLKAVYLVEVVVRCGRNNTSETRRRRGQAQKSASQPQSIHRNRNHTSQEDTQRATSSSGLSITNVLKYVIHQ